jgi:hypothetical protein
MTLEQLLDNSADKLEAMTNAELEAFFQPYLCVTRPELAKPDYKTTMSRPSISKSHQQLELAKKLDFIKQLAASKGVKLDI